MIHWKVRIFFKKIYLLFFFSLSSLHYYYNDMNCPVVINWVMTLLKLADQLIKHGVRQRLLKNYVLSLFWNRYVLKWKKYFPETILLTLNYIGIFSASKTRGGCIHYCSHLFQTFWQKKTIRLKCFALYYQYKPKLTCASLHSFPFSWSVIVWA